MVSFSRCPSHLGQYQCERYDGHLGLTHNCYDNDYEIDVMWVGPGDEATCHECGGKHNDDEADANDEALVELIKRTPISTVIGRA